MARSGASAQGAALTSPLHARERLGALLDRGTWRGDVDSASGFWNKLSERSQSNLYFALVFLDRRRRDAFRDVYRFVRAADDVADSPGDPRQNIARLGEWREELAAIYGPDRDGSPHPYALRLRDAVRRYSLSREHFECLLDGLELDIRTRRLRDFAALRAYCEGVASPLARLCLQILGVHGPAEERYAHDVGIALQLANILRDIREDAERDHIYLPMDELEEAGVSEQDVLRGHASPGLARVCRSLASRAETLIVEARAGLPARARRRLLVPEIWADVYLDLLRQLARADFDVFNDPPYLRRRRKLAIALRRWAGEAARARVLRFFPERPGMW